MGAWNFLAGAALIAAPASATMPQAVADGGVASLVTDAPPADGFVRIASGTPIELEIVDAQSSKTAVIDGMFAIRVLSPVMAGERVAIPVGTVGQGQVVHAAKARALGKAGELILAARFVTCGDTRIALRGFRLDGTGQDKTGTLMAAAVVGGLAAAPLMFMSGGDTVVPQGAHAKAKIGTTTDLRLDPATCPAQAGADMSVPTGTIKVGQPVIAPAIATAMPAGAEPAVAATAPVARTSQTTIKSQ